MNIALCRLKELNVYEEIRDTKNAIGVAKTARKLDDKYYLPTQENFVHFLTKIQSFSKLLIRIVMCARESHRLFLEILHRSAFIEITSLFISNLAEIWTICIDMCKSVVQFYHEFRRHFVKSYEQLKKMPKHLDRWLGSEYNEYIDFDVDQIELKNSEDYVLFDGTDAIERRGPPTIEQKFEPKLLVSQQIQNNRQNSRGGNNDVPSTSTNKMFKTRDLLAKPELKTETIPKLVSDVQKPKSTISMKSMPFGAKFESLDLGEKISRDNPMKTEKELKPIKHINVEEVKTIREIREFLTVEDGLRYAKQHKNSEGIPENEWNKFKIATNQILILGHPGLVLRKFKIIWQKLIRTRRR